MTGFSSSAIFSTGLQALLPAITLLTGILSLYIDPNKEPRKKWVIVSVLTLSAVATVGMGVHDNHSHQVESDALNKALGSSEDSLNYVKSSLDAARSDIGVVVNYLATRFGYSPEQLRDQFSKGSPIKQLQVSISADQQRTTLLTSKSLTVEIKPTVFYYAKDVDTAVVKSALQEASLNVIIKPPLDPNPTNVIWIGDKISPDVAHFVALTVVRAGVKLNRIMRFNQGSGKKEHLIEIGAYEDYRSLPVLSVDDILSMKDFPRDPKPGATHL